MKKNMLKIFPLVLCMCMLWTVMAFAQETAEEAYDVSLYIEGQKIDLKGNLVVYKDRTYLPFRELLTLSGVKDDQQNILWNSKERSVSFRSDNNTAKLFVGSSQALLNDQPVELGLEPIIYEDRTYIPLRSTEKLLNKKVIWEDTSRSIYMADATTFNKISEIGKKVQEAMDAEALKTSAKMNFELQMKESESNLDVGMSFVGDFKADNKSKQISGNLSMKMLFQSLVPMMNFEYFADETYFYFKSPEASNWSRFPIKGEGLELPLLPPLPDSNKTQEEIFYTYMAYREEGDHVVLYANLKNDLDANPLLGQIQLDNAATIEIFIKKDSFLLEKIEAKLDENSDRVKMKMNGSLVFEYKSDFTVDMPASLKDQLPRLEKEENKGLLGL